MHRQRLGHETTQVWCCVEMAIRRVLERGARQPESIANRSRVVSALVGRRPVRTRAIAGVALDGTPDGIGSAKHRLDASALHRIADVEREPQHRHAVVGLARPRRLLVRAPCPALTRHRPTLHLMYDTHDDHLAYARARRHHPPAARGGDSSPSTRASTWPAMVMLTRAAHLGRLRRAANQPHDTRARRQLRDLEVRGAPDPIDNDATARCAWRPAPTRRPTRVVGGRRHADPDPGPSPGGSLEELSVVMQRADSHPPTRPADCRHHGGRSRQPQRPCTLPRLEHRGTLQANTVVSLPMAAIAASLSSSPRWPTFRGNRILRDRAWRRHRRRRARVEHAIARLKNWRILRDHRRRGAHLADTLQAVTFLHNLQLDELRDSL